MSLLISWNPKVKLILSDVDETLAGVYLPVDPKLIPLLNTLLARNVKLFLISGGELNSICNRVVFKLDKKLRKNILVSHCSGSEVWGFSATGELLDAPFYSIYEESLKKSQRRLWRQIMKQVVSEFKLKTFPTMPVEEFKKKTQGDPLSIMYDDRGPQITFETVNAYNLSEADLKKVGFEVPLSHDCYDIRVPIARRADELFDKVGLPINSRIESVFALNFAIKGVSKETSIRRILDDPKKLKYLDLDAADLKDYNKIEIWGDKFSELRIKLDSLMSRSVDPRVRSIDFRQENREELPKGFNIQIWNGKKHLHEGLLEYLQQSLK